MALLRDLFVEMLREMYGAEKGQIAALPAMSRAATTDELENLFDEHLAQTEEHVYRLQRVFKMIGDEPGAKTSEAMAGLVREAGGLSAETENGSMTRDVALIAAAQKIEHYEMAVYGTLVQLASNMHLNEVAGLLEQTLREEKEADMQLTEVAERYVNWQALENENGGGYIRPLAETNR
ncbi:MAG TPA: ferritin-like domain-containing protein [Puia sp.]|nr:ferritin-like domain-containing protein [Puia sp.]